MPSRLSLSIECLRAVGSPQRRGSFGRGDGESYEVGGPCLWGAYSGWPPSLHRPIDCSNGESCPVGGRCLWSTHRGWRPPIVHAHWLGERPVLPSRWPLSMERLWGDSSPKRCVPTRFGDAESCPVFGCCLWRAYRGIVAPYDIGRLVGGKRCPKQSVVPPTGCRDTEFCPIVGRCLWSAYRGMSAPTGVGAQTGDTGNLAPPWVVAYGVPAWDCSPQRHGRNVRGHGDSW